MFFHCSYRVIYTDIPKKTTEKNEIFIYSVECAFLII